MRITTILLRQHNGFMFKKNWHIAKNRIIRDTGVRAYLEEKNIPITNPFHFLREQKER